MPLIKLGKGTVTSTNFRVIIKIYLVKCMEYYQLNL